MKREDMKMAKKALADAGIKVFQKDMKDVTIHKLNISDYVAHRRIYRVEMLNGKVYEAIQETVDADDHFSLDSARYITREAREV